MKERRIKNVESTSIGKSSEKNDDDIYIGKNFAAVIDGVSKKSTINLDGKKIKIANIITEAIRKIDRPSAPVYAKTLNFEEFVAYINMYIEKYCDRIGYSVKENPLEATGAIYSKYHNQIWLVGDCRAIYDGKPIEHELKIDQVYADIRTEIIKTLMKLGYSQNELFENDIAKEMIINSDSISQYIKSENEANRIKQYMRDKMNQTLLECGFSEEDIEKQNLLEKYSNPRELQKYLKNNPNVGEYGYAIFNGIKTETKNCIVKTLPQDVKKIRLSSDGFPMAALNTDKDLGYAIRNNRKLAALDPLSIGENKAVCNATRQNHRDYHLAIDDESAACIEIEYIEERDDER